MGISFLCSILESVLMSTPLSYITMREDAGFKPAKRFKEYKTDNGKLVYFCSACGQSKVGGFSSAVSISSFPRSSMTRSSTVFARHLVSLRTSRQN